MRDRKIRHISFYTGIIETMGYDPLRAILEVKLMNDGKIRRYDDVPEEIWYRLRETYHPDNYFRRYVCGRFSETILPKEEEE